MARGRGRGLCCGGNGGGGVLGEVSGEVRKEGEMIDRKVNGLMRW